MQLDKKSRSRRNRLLGEAERAVLAALMFVIVILVVLLAFILLKVPISGR
jgi:hypothetical protein